MNVSWRRSPKIGLHSGKASKLKAKKTVFVNEKRGLFFHALDGTDVFLGVAETTKMVVKSRPEKYAERCQIACTFGISGKKSYEHRKSRRYGEMGAALHDSA